MNFIEYDEEEGDLEQVDDDSKLQAKPWDSDRHEVREPEEE